MNFEHVSSKYVYDESFVAFLNKKYGTLFALFLRLYFSNLMETTQNVIFDQETLLRYLSKTFGRNMTDHIMKQYNQYLIENKRNVCKEYLQEIDVNSREIFQKPSQNQHIVIIYTKEEIRDQLLAEFFAPEFCMKITTGHFSHKKTTFGQDKTIKYSELKSDSNSLDSEKMRNFIYNIYSENSVNNTTRIACENTNWFKDNGLSDEHHQTINSLNKHVLNSCSFVCCYDAKTIDKLQLTEILENCEIVVFDNPVRVYISRISQKTTIPNHSRSFASEIENFLSEILPPLSMKVKQLLLLKYNYTLEDTLEDFSALKSVLRSEEHTSELQSHENIS